MRRSGRLAAVVGVLAMGSLAVADTTSAAGGPILPGAAYSPEGATAPGSPDRYVTLFAGGESVVARIRQNGGQVEDARSFGDYVIPAVTVDGEAGGLSADGSTRVLAHPRGGFRRPQTTFQVLDPRLRQRDRITLRGSFTFDAISPDGSRIYLIEYTSPSNPTRYEVRAYCGRRTCQACVEHLAPVRPGRVRRRRVPAGQRLVLPPIGS
jgi:hypothetical protein